MQLSHVSPNTPPSRITLLLALDEQSLYDNPYHPESKRRLAFGIQLATIPHIRHLAGYLDHDRREMLPRPRIRSNKIIPVCDPPLTNRQSLARDDNQGGGG